MFSRKETIDPKEWTYASGKTSYSYDLSGNVDLVVHIMASDDVCVGLDTKHGYLPIYRGSRGRVSVRVRDVTGLRIDAPRTARIAHRVEVRDLMKGTTLSDYRPVRLTPPAPVPIELKSLVRNAIASQLASQGVQTIDIDEDDDLSLDVPDQDDFGPGWMDEDEPFNPHGRPQDPRHDDSEQAAPAAPPGNAESAAPAQAPAATSGSDTP